jgi:ADP-heptose:LPS heptosyltransferase
LRQAIVSQGALAEVLIGREDISEVARVLTHAEMLVTVNTGIMHLGAILGVPTVSINGPTSIHRWGPIGPRVVNVCPPDESGGFLDLGFEYRGRLENVMEKISVADVLHAVQQLRGMPTDASVAPNMKTTRETADLRAMTVDNNQLRTPFLRPEKNRVELR